jgi:hypothetical protein
MGLRAVGWKPYGQVFKALSKRAARGELAFTACFEQAFLE